MRQPLVDEHRAPPALRSRKHQLGLHCALFTTHRPIAKLMTGCVTCGGLAGAIEHRPRRLPGAFAAMVVMD